MALRERTPKSPTLPAAIDAMDAPQYLGDTIVIEGMIRNFFNDALQRRIANDTSATDQDQKDAQTLAEILLGEHPNDFRPQPAWNRPGGLDAYLAKKLELEDIDPADRVATALLGALMIYYNIVTYAQQPGVLEEQWNWQVDVLVQDTRNLLLGIELQNN